MIIVYTAPSCPSSRRATNWLKKNQILYTERRINKKKPLTKEELKKILYLTEKGWDDLLCVRSEFFKEIETEFENYSFEKAIVVAINNPSLIKKPIIFDGKITRVGFNENIMRSYIPKKRRKQNLIDYYTGSSNSL